MSPRPYNSSQRREAAEATRERIVAAAHALLADPVGVSAFTVEAVARRAGVARMTVYNQFGSKAAVLEALFDWLAAHGGIHGPRGLPQAVREPDPLDGLRMMFEAMARYYSVDRTVKRRVHALAALQPDVGDALALREARRRPAIRALLERIAAARAPWPPGPREELEQLLFTLTSFDAFDVLAGPSRTFPEVAPLLAFAARTLVAAE
ncbi:TetR/AcrR family transcriptional regulator [Longimicrobium sp.]|uniref:TetR/AcrR family transcriptional regulator n=1 Tax=Longimicrobium sp. TaxID=2029185 RepID=UPI003B3A340D